jgi:hypothetical protein
MNEKEFLKDLRALMEKHNVMTFDFGASPASDWHGIRDEHMFVRFKERDEKGREKSIRISDATWFTSRDLDDLIGDKVQEEEDA